jgi:anti-anti-sigma regulatory factor
VKRAFFEATVALDTVTVVLGGEFDITSQGFLSGRLDQIRRAGPRRLIFEAAQVAYMDVASARAIADTGGWLPAARKPVIRHPSPIVHRLFQISGISHRCDFEFKLDGS